MRRIVFLFFIVSAVQFLAFSANAQTMKIGYVDSQAILEKMPEYKELETALEKLTQDWLKEIEDKKKVIDTLKINYKAEEILLTAEMKQQRLEEIDAAEKELKEFQANTFGYEGLLYIKRQEFVKPIQAKILEATEKVAKKKRLQFIFDKAGDFVMLYSDPRHNYTDYVLEEMGLGDPADTPRQE